MSENVSKQTSQARESTGSFDSSIKSPTASFLLMPPPPRPFGPDLPPTARNAHEAQEQLNNSGPELGTFSMASSNNQHQRSLCQPTSAYPFPFLRSCTGFGGSQHQPTAVQMGKKRAREQHDSEINAKSQEPCETALKRVRFSSFTAATSTAEPERHVRFLLPEEPNHGNWRDTHPTAPALGLGAGKRSAAAEANDRYWTIDPSMEEGEDTEPEPEPRDLFPEEYNRGNFRDANAAASFLGVGKRSAAAEANDRFWTIDPLVGDEEAAKHSRKNRRDAQAPASFDSSLGARKRSAAAEAKDRFWTIDP
ncbi:hypothetical protein K402DRAFT_419637 [Aulographum hederae CBS 113979]|uniref:Uncharacterized protein n=1 Tax=Aulographum hederae CBS 113979 TaxID=1176131 RepID=A0A6G1H5L9_9PEZI|nr:hypothetical protein K402DRAFT_419637 [Aulographum hederae CBS 113979]